MTPNFRPPVSVGPLAAKALPHLFPEGLEDWTLVFVAVNATEDEVQTAALNAAVQVYGELSPDQLRLHPAGVVICADPQDPSRAVARLAIRVDTTQEPS